MIDFENKSRDQINLMLWYWGRRGYPVRLVQDFTHHLMKRENVSEVIMAGQVKHARIFSNIRPDWRLIKVLASLTAKNTDGLIGGVARELEKEGIPRTAFALVRSSGDLARAGSRAECAGR